MGTILSVLIFIQIAGSCKPVQVTVANPEYQIAQQALIQYNASSFVLVPKPYNREIVRYTDGFSSDEIDLRKEKFSFVVRPVIKWEEDKKVWGTQTEKKIIAIKEYEKYKKVSLTDSNKAITFISLSNPAFSVSGNYAIINLNIFHNTVITETYSYIMVFKNTGGKWLFVTQFEASVS